MFLQMTDISLQPTTWHHDIYTPSLAAETSTWQYTTDICAPGEIQTHDLSRRATADRQWV